jgi:hypothetical protein
MSRRRLSALAAVLALSVPLLAGCGTVKVRYDAGSAHTAPDDVLKVSFGDSDPASGDWWYVVGAPNEKVLRDEGASCSPTDGTCHSSTPFSWDFYATGKGNTQITFRYCYKSRPDNCQPGPGRGPAAPVTLSVEVKEMTSL